MKLPFRPYEGQEPYIFADFSHKDNETVFPLLKAMNRVGYRIWYSAGIPWGTDWRDTMADRIRNCAAAVVFLSQYSVSSTFFDAEVNELINWDKKVVPICLETDIALSGGVGFYLREFPLVPLYEDESPDRFLEDLSHQDILAPCRTTQKEAG